jgi:hypothetical protein
MRTGCIWTGIATGAVLVLVAPAGHAARSAAEASKPFKYTYRITALDVDAEYRAAGSTATTHLRLDGPSKKRWISWFGPKPMGGAPTQVSAAVLYLTGQASYSSPDPSCFSKFTFTSSRSHPVRSVLSVDTVTSKKLRIRVEVGQFPIARALRGQDSGSAFSGYENRCGKAEARWYDNAQAIVPAAAMTKPSFVVVANRHEKFAEDNESIDWTLKMTVMRERYHLIDCATESGC